MKKGKSKRKEIPWNELGFERQEMDFKVIAKCLKCLITLKNTSYERLLGHRNACESRSNSGNISTKNPATSRSDAGIALKKQKKDESFMNKEDLSIIDEALGKFFFGCNIPFSIVESDHFKKFINVLNPNYKPPSRVTLSGSLLNKIHSNLIEEHSKLVDEQSVLLVDGWKNKSKNEKYVVCMIHNASGERIFVDSKDFTEKSETALAVKETVNEAIINAKEKLGTNIYAVVSDNASTMTCMEKTVGCWDTTCNSHSGNLLALSLVETTTLQKKVIPVLKEFKSPFLERQIINKGGTKMSLPGETRWCSYRDSFRYFLRNLTLMRETLNENNSKISKQVASIITDEKIESDVLEFTIILDAVCELINKFQSDNYNIADGIEEWLKLQFPTCNESYEMLLKKRLKKVVPPISLAANVLHPGYRGELFKDHSEYYKMAQIFIEENLDSKNQKDLESYLNQEGIFQTLKNKQIKNPEVFWSLAEVEHPALSRLATKLLKIPCSTAAIERLFSQWIHVHSKIRNVIIV